MSLLAKFCFSCLAVSSLATTCPESQHCSDCNNTGYCITDCDPGYYDYKCKSNCSKNCRNKTCSIASNGNDNCTHGCVPGFQGTSCIMPCDSPGDSCTACPGGCDGEYCQLGSSCVSGCVDFYYGTDCNNTCNTDCNQEGGHPTSVIAVVALCVACVHFTLTILVAIALRCWHIKREGSREQLEDDYDHKQYQRRPSPDTVRQTNDTYAEVDYNDTGRVVIFL